MFKKFWNKPITWGASFITAGISMLMCAAWWLWLLKPWNRDKFEDD